MPPHDADERPNVLLICTDHWPGQLMRPAGHPVVMTPTLEQLARSGTRFDQAYSACPVCIPARRNLMLGQSNRAHGCRHYDDRLPMAGDPTIARAFQNAGYQSFAVGKLHVYPQRDRIGFQDVTLIEEGRRQYGMGADDWEQYLAEQGYAGREYETGVNNNDYIVSPWHLPDHCHPTNWSAREMCRTIRRRDPGRPGFWYLSFIGPHPPVWPLTSYLDQYRDVEMDQPVMGDWARDRPPAGRHMSITNAPPHEVDLARRAFYATLTHIDHQLRIVIGALSEEGLLHNTIIAFTADHGDMLGDHGLWAKQRYYERAAQVPLIISTPRPHDVLQHGRTDHRLVELRDLMPTLLDLAGVDIPDAVDGISLARDQSRDLLYGEINEGPGASRMIRDADYKLIYDPLGNRVQLFHTAQDKRDMHDLVDDPAHAQTRERLEQALIDHMYGSDLEWVRQGRLVGVPAPEDAGPLPAPGRSFSGQRGYRFIR